MSAGKAAGSAATTSAPSPPHTVMGVSWKVVAAVAVPVVVAGAVGGYFLTKKSRKSAKSSRRRDTATPVPKQEASTDANDVEFATTTARNVQEAAEAAEEVAKQAEQEPKADQLMSDEKREELAMAAKDRGNKYYTGRKYEQALELYAKAIGYFPGGDPRTAVFYSNRAACWANLQQVENVIEDCTRALAADPSYVKALIRRGNSYEKQGRLTEALHDFTCACVAENFANATYVGAADRVIKQLASQRAKELFSIVEMKDELPSVSFMTAYLNSFQYQYLSDEDLGQPVPADSGDAKFISAVNALKGKKYDKAWMACRKALELGLDKFRAQALNLHGTFCFLRGDTAAATTSFEESLELQPNCVNVLIKMASVVMEAQSESGIATCISWFDKAFIADPSDPDAFYHRGQMFFLVRDYKSALEDYEKSIELAPSFMYAKIQRAVLQYRVGNVAESETLFQQLKTQFPDVGDVYYYSGEILLDQQKVEESLKDFDKAIKFSPHLPLAYINKAVILAHVQGDVERAIEMTQKAIKVDNKCDLAYMHLAQLYTQQGKLNEAVIMYKRAADLARTSADFENAIMGMEAGLAQLAAIQRLAGTAAIPRPAAVAQQ